MKKYPKLGLETEFLLLDEAGQVTNSADILMQSCSKKRTAYHLRQEAAKCMVEIGATPKHTVHLTTKGFLRTMADILDRAEKLDLSLLPLGTYPGRMIPKIRNKEWYRMQEWVVGKKRWDSVLGKVAGFHFHHCLPKGTFDWDNWRLRRFLRSSAARTLVNQYNFLIAADPASMTLMQSSPFYDGRYLCKDSRTILYRDLSMKKPKVRGLYHELPSIGGLPHYEHTLTDLNELIDSRRTLWFKHLQKSHPGVYKRARKANPLRFYWGPLRINRAGTFEQRGMDMNLLSNLIGASALLKSGLEGIESQALQIIPSEIGIRQPFRREGSIVYVPPYSHVNNVLQMQSIRSGLAEKEVLNYCKRFYRFAIGFLDAPPDISIRSVKRIMDEGETLSDKIISHVKKRGGDIRSEIDPAICAEIALKYAEELRHEVPKLINHYLALDVGEEA